MKTRDMNDFCIHLVFFFVSHIYQSIFPLNRFKIITISPVIFCFIVKLFFKIFYRFIYVSVTFSGLLTRFALYCIAKKSLSCESDLRKFLLSVQGTYQSDTKKSSDFPTFPRWRFYKFSQFQ